MSRESSRLMPPHDSEMPALGVLHHRPLAITVALNDVIAAFRNFEFWGSLGWMETRRRYRRTVLGPFWATASMAIFVGTIGILYAYLWHQDVKIYLPYLVSGLLAWQLIAGIVTESNSAFINAEGAIKQVNLPLSIFVLLAVYRNVILFGHNLVVYVVVAILMSINVSWNTLLLIPAIVLVIVNGWWVGIILASACTRFRDVQQLIQNIMQILLFVTPVLWPIEQLGSRGLLFVVLNPMYHFIQITREPLLGNSPAISHWIYAVCTAVVGWLLTLVLFGRIRQRLVYWL